MMHPAIAKKARIERVHTDANGLQIMGNTVKLTLLDKDDNVMAIWWGAESLMQYIDEAHNIKSRGTYREEVVNVFGFGLNRHG